MPKILEKYTPEKESFQFRTDVVVIIFVIIVAVLVALLLYKFRQRGEQNGAVRQVERPENRTIAETSLRAERKDLARLSNDLKTVSHRVLTKLNSLECRSACPSCLKKFDDGAHIMCIIPFCQHTICINCIPFEPEAMDCPKCGEPYFSSEIELNEDFLNYRYQ